MNAKFFKRVIFNKKSRRGFKKFLRKPNGLRRNYNNIRRKINYNFNSRVQTYGPSSTVINITGLIEWDMSDNSFNHAELISNFILSEEFKKFENDFEFIKILGIGVTIYPNDELNNTPTYLALNWVSASMTENEIVTSDKAKIVYNDAKRQKTYYFRPPDVITHDNFNPRRFNLISNFKYSSLYLALKQDGGSLKARVDIRLCFRGPVTPPSLKIKKMQNNIIYKSFLSSDSEIKEIVNENKKEKEKNKYKKNQTFEEEGREPFPKLKNLKDKSAISSGVSNYSFLKNLIIDGEDEEKILTSKNFKKLKNNRKLKIRKLLQAKKTGKINKYLEDEKNKKKLMKEEKKSKIKNKNLSEDEDEKIEEIKINKNKSKNKNKEKEIKKEDKKNETLLKLYTEAEKLIDLVKNRNEIFNKIKGFEEVVNQKKYEKIERFISVINKMKDKLFKYDNDETCEKLIQQLNDLGDELDEEAEAICL
jgi:hypothetical protein